MPITIVGVGASAGGLEAFTQLLSALPLDTGMGFVLVQHLDPEHVSALTHLLARATSLPVREITNNERVQPNHVYVIPPDTNLSIASGVLQLRRRERTRSPHRPIDSFFESLASDQLERAIGVVLSGTASDGTLGLEAIKAEGGITFAQDDSAKYDSMPRSAVAAGCVDLVLAPADIAKELARIAKHPFVVGRVPSNLVPGESEAASDTAHPDDQAAPPSGERDAKIQGGEDARVEVDRPTQGEAEAKASKGAENGFKKILLLLRNHSGVDFSLYKSSTIQRRIARRLVLNKRSTLADYAAFLKGNSAELDSLYSDVLISVTSFFRNPEAFEVLERETFPKLLKQRAGRGGDDPIRVWVLGCSTGQEAYSIAMAFVEAAEKAPRTRPLQVFATDLNDKLLDKARHGLYPKTLADEVSPQRLRRFFVEEEGGYRVIKMLREMVVFARQNLISDPPFSRMDLISCRNLLIYLEPGLQKKALPTFHYALKPDGFLMLGASESVGAFTDLFEPVDKKQKIYVRRSAPTPALHLPAMKERGKRAAQTPPPLPLIKPDAAVGPRGELNAQREADRIAVNQFAPPSVLVNNDLQVLQFRGPTGAYLEPPAGKASFDVLKMAREGLMLPLRAAINQAKKENKTARKQNVRLKGNKETRTVNLQVIPLKNLRERCFLIQFEDAQRAGKAHSAEPAQPSGKPSRLTAKEERSRIGELENDLAEARDYLQSTQEQQEAANEELQAANEEVQSANEELQSINEELETSKEELESANEELTTVNEEMSHRNLELNRLNSDLINFQSSTRLAIMLLGRDLTIRRFSTQAEKQFDLLATDLGRPLGNVRHNLIIDDLEAFVRDVIDTVREREREVQDKSGRWYSLRVRPYLTLDNKVDGAVLVLLDINLLKLSEQSTVAARDYAEATLRTARDPVLVLRGDLRVNTANEAFYRTFKTTPDQTEGVPIFELTNGAWAIPSLKTLLEEILPRNSVFHDFEVTHDFPRMGKRTMLLNARRLQRNDGTPEMILLSIEDVTERLQFQVAIRQSEQRYRRLFEAAHDGILILNPVSRKIIDANPFMSRLLGYTKEELFGKELWQIGLLKDEQASHAAFRELRETGSIRYEDLPLLSKSGEMREVEVVANLYQEDGEKVIQCNVRDITERKQAVEALRESEGRFRGIFNQTLVGIGETDAMGQFVRANSRYCQIVGRSIDELRSLRMQDITHPEDLQRNLPLFQRAVKEGTSFLIEKRYVRPDGSQVWVSNSVSAVKDGDGNSVRVIAACLDITERKVAEHALRESAERYRVLVEQVKDYAIFRTDAEGRATTWNEGVWRVLGFDEAEFIGKDVNETIFTAEDFQKGVPQRELDEAVANGSASDDRWMRRKSGERFFAAGVTTALKDEQGQLVGFTAFRASKNRASRRVDCNVMRV